MSNAPKSLNDEAWEKLFSKYDILNQIDDAGQFVISATQIKEFREPRLMAKFDPQHRKFTVQQQARKNGDFTHTRKVRAVIIDRLQDSESRGAIRVTVGKKDLTLAQKMFG